MDSVYLKHRNKGETGGRRGDRWMPLAQDASWGKGPQCLRLALHNFACPLAPSLSLCRCLCPGLSAFCEDSGVHISWVRVRSPSETCAPARVSSMSLRWARPRPHLVVLSTGPLAFQPQAQPLRSVWVSYSLPTGTLFISLCPEPCPLPGTYSYSPVASHAAVCALPPTSANRMPRQDGKAHFLGLTSL